MRYITVFRYTNEVEVVELHNKYFRDKKPLYGFLFSKEEANHNLKDLYIEVSLKKDDALFLSLQLGLKLTLKTKPVHNALDQYSHFDTLTYFRFSDLEI